MLQSAIGHRLGAMANGPMAITNHQSPIINGVYRSIGDS
jgi:hypothetical protein